MEGFGGKWLKRWGKFRENFCHVEYSAIWDEEKNDEIMREIQASEAKTHLARLLDEVERGETLVITRHGRAIARIVPEIDRKQEQIDEAMRANSKSEIANRAIEVEELLSARDESRKA